MTRLLEEKPKIIINAKLAEQFLNQFEVLILKPIKDLLKSKTSHLYIFALMSVALDNLSNIRYCGVHTVQSGSGYRYRKFINKYMPKEYRREAYHLYEDFRCKIVHEFQLKHFDLRQDKKSYSHHLKKQSKKDLVILNSTKFFGAINEAFTKLKTEIVSNKSSDAFKTLISSKYRLWYHTHTKHHKD